MREFASKKNRDTIRNERWEVTEMRDEDFAAKRIAINDETPDEQTVIDVPYDKFHKHFTPGWCITTHKAHRT